MKSIFDIAYQEFRVKRFPPTTQIEIAEVKKRSRVTFPDHYREYLLQYNGGNFQAPGPCIDAPSEEYPTPGMSWMFGIGASHPVGELYDVDRLNLWDGNDHPILYPIGSTEEGFFILLITEPADDFGCIYLRTFESPIFKTEDKSHYLAENMVEFFSLLEESEDVE